MRYTDTMTTMWKHLISVGFTPEGTAGLMGNLYAESGCNPMLVERLCLKRLRETGQVYDDTSYTVAVDIGRITRSAFLSPLGKHYGYGLAQWTTRARKAVLYDLCKQRRVSISDLRTQLDYLCIELSQTFQKVNRVLRTTHSIKEASDIVLLKFEAPADAEKQCGKRMSYSQEIYDHYFKKEDRVVGYDKYKVIAIAKAEVGYLEKAAGDLKYLYDKTANAGDKNFTKYGYEMHKTYPKTMDYPAYWCDAFVDWCFMTAYGISSARSLLGGEFDDYTVASAQLYKSKGAWHNTPEVGDQVFFKNSARICHTGLVVDVRDGKIITVEGNTNSGKEIVRNGGAVCVKEYSIGNSRIAGYGRPAYGKSFDFKPHWEHIGDTWYYCAAPGGHARGWKTINGHWYYFAPDGKMLTGLQEIGGKRYYLMEFGDFEGACCRTDESGALMVWDV